MTQNRATAAILILAATFVALFAALTSTPAQQPAAAAAGQTAIVMHRIDAIPAGQQVIQQTAGTEPLSSAQVTEQRWAADRVCEGMTSGVSLLEMADTLAAQEGLTDTEAHDFVRDAAQHCDAR